MSLSLCPLLMPVFLLIGGSVVPVKAFDTQTQIDCPYDSGCQAVVKLMVAVEETKDKLDEKFYKQAEDMKELKEHLERISADLLRHDARLKAHVESTSLQNNPKPHDCSDVQTRGNSVSGVYQVNPGRSIEKDVYCDFSIPGQSWLVFQRRKDGSVSFDRTWNEYANGFGNLNGEFWLGNEILSLLTEKKKYKLRIEMEDADGVKRWAEYSTFSISPATDKYRLTATGITGTAGPGDSMAYHTGKQFATAIASDGSNLPECDDPLSGGWWFNGCAYKYGNLNARYGSIYWYYVLFSTHSLKATEMKIAAV